MADEPKKPQGIPLNEGLATAHLRQSVKPLIKAATTHHLGPKLQGSGSAVNPATGGSNSGIAVQPSTNQQGASAQPNAKET